MAQKTLDQIAEIARSHRISPEEHRAQRVSLIMGVRSSNSTLTRDKIEGLVNQNEGVSTGTGTGSGTGTR